MPNNTKSEKVPKIKSKEEILSPLSHVSYPYNARKANLQPIGTIENVVIFLTLFEETKDKIKYNLFNQQVEFNGERLTDDHIVGIWVKTERYSGMVAIKMELVARAIYFIASGNKYDPFIDYLDAQVWDKKPRLTSMIANSFGVEDNEYHQAIGHNWLLALMYRQLQPGFKWDNMITLVGQVQGLGKTSFFVTLVSGFSDKAVKILKSDFENKDTLKKMSAGAVIVNIDEGAAFGKKAQESIKTFVSEQFDEYRDPFAREMKVHQRRFVFGMTENNMHPFGDPTGARRYWPVDVVNKVNFKWIEENRDQIFAEAWYKAKQGEPFMELSKELTDDIQEMHREHDIWEEKVVDYLVTQRDFAKAIDEYTVKPSAIFKDGFNIDIEKIEQRQERRLGNCLRALGFTPVTKRIDGKVSRVWLIKRGNIDRIVRNLSDADMKKFREHSGTLNDQFEAF